MVNICSSRHSQLVLSVKKTKAGEGSPAACSPPATIPRLLLLLLLFCLGRKYAAMNLPEGNCNIAAAAAAAAAFVPTCLPDALAVCYGYIRAKTPLTTLTMQIASDALYNMR